MKLLHESAGDIVDCAIAFMGITDDDFASKSRRLDIVMSKVIVTYCLLYLQYPLSYISKIVLKHHSSLIHYKVLIMEDSLARQKIVEFKMFMSERGIFVPSIDAWVDRVGDEGRVIRSYDKNSKK